MTTETDRRRLHCVQLGTGEIPIAPPRFKTRQPKDRNSAVCCLIGYKFSREDMCLIQLFGEWESILDLDTFHKLLHNLSCNPIAIAIHDYTGRLPCPRTNAFCYLDYSHPELTRNP